jgi:hypothetical protein
MLRRVLRKAKASVATLRSALLVFLVAGRRMHNVPGRIDVVIVVATEGERVACLIRKTGPTTPRQKGKHLSLLRNVALAFRLSN